MNKEKNLGYKLSIDFDKCGKPILKTEEITIPSEIVKLVKHRKELNYQWGIYENCKWWQFYKKASSRKKAFKEVELLNELYKKIAHE